MTGFQHKSHAWPDQGAIYHVQDACILGGTEASRTQDSAARIDVPKRRGHTVADGEASRPVRVGLLWHSVSQANLGVGALTMANIIIIEEAAKRAGVSVEFDVVGWRDLKNDCYVDKPNLRIMDLVGRDFLPNGRLGRILAGCDLVFDIGAGDSFSDIYGFKRFAYQALSKWWALRAGRPLILSPQTLGPFRSRAAGLVARWILHRSHQVFSRDQRSIEVLARAGVTRPITLASDVAFRLPYTPPKPAEAAPSTPRVGMNVSALLYHGHARFGLRCDYPSLVRACIDDFSSRMGCELVLVPHVLAETVDEDDARVSEQLRHGYPGVSLAPRFRGPSEAKTFIAGLDYFVGARMHACIAAFSAGVPVVPLAYSRKFSGLFSALGYDEVVDCVNVGTETARAAVVDGFRRRTQLADAVAAGNQLAAARLRGYELAVEDALCLAVHQAPRADDDRAR